MCPGRCPPKSHHHPRLSQSLLSPGCWLLLAPKKNTWGIGTACWQHKTQKDKTWYLTKSGIISDYSAEFCNAFFLDLGTHRYGASRQGWRFLGGSRGVCSEWLPWKFTTWWDQGLQEEQPPNPRQVSAHIDFVLCLCLVPLVSQSDIWKFEDIWSIQFLARLWGMICIYSSIEYCWKDQCWGFWLPWELFVAERANLITNCAWWALESPSKSLRPSFAKEILHVLGSVNSTAPDLLYACKAWQVQKYSYK